MNRIKQTKNRKSRSPSHRCALELKNSRSSEVGVAGSSNEWHPAPLGDLLSDGRSLQELKIVGVYADLTSHLHATRLLRNVAGSCSTVCKVDPVWWSFDVLTSAFVREAAARAAAEADMIWCSTHACEPLPETVRAWVDAWCEFKGDSDAALVALLRCPPNYNVEHCPTRAYLSQAAQEAGMEIFVQRFDCACGDSLNAPSTMSSMRLSYEITEDHPNWHQFRHWGINE